MEDMILGLEKWSWLVSNSQVSVEVIIETW
jgi:hypothetical protein